MLLAAAWLSVGPHGASAARRSDCARRFPTVIRDGFPEARMIFSRNGQLTTTLRAAVGPVTIAGHRYVTMSYDGSYPAPTLVFCPGDHVTIHLINDLPSVTNLHLHGLHVSPRGNSDNVFLNIRPGQRYTYQYSVPRDQPSGFFWFHPHRHEFVEPQIDAGMAGAIVVQGALDDGLAGIPQRIMVIQATELCDPTGHSIPFGNSGSHACSPAGGTVPVATARDADRYTPLLMNGALNPVAHIRPGQIQRWRIVNASADRFVQLTLAGQTVQVLAQDGNTLRWMRPYRTLLIPPGSRREILVRGGRPGHYVIRATNFLRFPGEPDFTPNQAVMTLVSGGRSTTARMPRGPLSSLVDLGRAHVDRYRRIVFSDAPDGTQFLLNHHTFDPNYVPITMKLNSIEQWTLVNTSTNWHTFHIHQNPFQVISINGRKVDYIDYQDNVGLHPKSTTVIRMHPIDFTGKLVFHCHVTYHEDNGMMSAVAIAKNPTRAQLAASTAAVHGIAISSSAYGSSRLPPLPRAILLFCHLLGIQPPSGLTAGS
jgi:FtsP/CotA-like multicopper oxidase with cupredoxin domain